MPVRFANCQVLQDAAAAADQPDIVHVCASPTTKNVWLGDIFTGDSGIYSIGDVLIETGSTASWIAYPLWLFIFWWKFWKKEKFYLEK